MNYIKAHRTSRSASRSGDAEDPRIYSQQSDSSIEDSFDSNPFCNIESLNHGHTRGTKEIELQEQTQFIGGALTHRTYEYKTKKTLYCLGISFIIAIIIVVASIIVVSLDSNHKPRSTPVQQLHSDSQTHIQTQSQAQQSQSQSQSQLYVKGVKFNYHKLNQDSPSSNDDTIPQENSGSDNNEKTKEINQENDAETLTSPNIANSENINTVNSDNSIPAKQLNIEQEEQQEKGKDDINENEIASQNVIVNDNEGGETKSAPTPATLTAPPIDHEPKAASPTVLQENPNSDKTVTNTNTNTNTDINENTNLDDHDDSDKKSEVNEESDSDGQEETDNTDHVEKKDNDGIKNTNEESESKLENENIDWSYKALFVENEENSNILQTIVNFDNGKFVTKVETAAMFHLAYPKNINKITNINSGGNEFKYENNIFHRWCHVFSLPNENRIAKTSAGEVVKTHHLVQIDVVFNVFSLERGFDRLLIRLFNQTMMKAPIVIAGRGFYDVNNLESVIANKQWRVPDNLTLYLHSGETLGVCLELETDQDNVCDQNLQKTNNNNGNDGNNEDKCGKYGAFDVDIIARYDDKCKWEPWSQCKVIPGEQWGGECGIGVKQRVRSAVVNSAVGSDSNNNGVGGENELNGYVANCNKNFGGFNNSYNLYKYDTSIEGPFYCNKLNCGDYDHSNNSKLAETNRDINHPYSISWSGHNRLDPDNPQLFDILYPNPNPIPKTTANPNGDANENLQTCLNSISHPIYTIEDRLASLENCDESEYFMFAGIKRDTVNDGKSDGKSGDDILSQLIATLQKEVDIIVSDRESEALLSLGIIMHSYFNQSQKYLGARLAQSLLIGRPFIISFTGSSNTAGHDSMYASTYSIQLNSRLRPIWQKYGNTGSSFNVRNVAIGGNVGTVQRSYFIHVQSCETPSTSYERDGALGISIDGATKTITKMFAMNNRIDAMYWESFMNDGGQPPLEFVEFYVRNCAMTNAIFGAVNMVGSCDNATYIKKWDELTKNQPTTMPSHGDIFETSWVEC